MEKVFKKQIQLNIWEFKLSKASPRNNRLNL